MMNRKNGFGRGRRILGTAAAGLLVLTSSACATINYDAATLQSVAAMNRVAPAGSYERVAEFNVSQRPVFVIAQLLTVVDAKLDEALERELRRADAHAVLNVRIHEEYDVIDFLIGAVQGALLFGANIVQTRSVSIRGDLVRWNTGFLESEAGMEWLAQNCRVALLDDAEDGGSRTAHVCARPEAEKKSRTMIGLGLAD